MRSMVATNKGRYLPVIQNDTCQCLCLYLIVVGLICPSAYGQEPPPAPVSVVEAATAPVYEEIPLTASVTARRLSQISPKVGGLISVVLVDDGNEVKQGDPLLRLDRVMAEIELTQARAELNEARARLKEAKRQRDEAAELVKDNSIASTSYEASVAEVEINAAAVSRLEAGVMIREETLARHTIYAPFDGIVTGKLIEAGEWVDTRTTLFELAEIDVLRIVIPVPQYYFNQIEIGTAVRIRFDSLPDRVFYEKITGKVPMGSSSARTFPVLIDMRNTDRMISPGMSARVRIQLEQIGEALLVPRDAIIKRPDGSESVWVVDQEKGVFKAKSIQIQTGKAFNGNLEVVEGLLNIGDKVVVRGNEILRPNEVVRISEEIKSSL